MKPQRIPTIEEWWKTPVSAHRLIMATHNAEHAVLSQPVRLSVRHLNESLGALHRKATAINELPLSFGKNSFGLLQPTGQQQQQIFDLHREFFDLTYSTISALASTLNRLSKRVQGVPWNSNEKFLSWLRDDSGTSTHYFGQEQSSSTLQAARDFRTIYTHPGQWKPFDWQTVSMEDRVAVVLLGVQPPIPPGVEVVAGSVDQWRFLAPHPNEVLWSFASVAGFFFGTLFPAYEWDNDRCKWEEQGLGSAPAIALEKKVAEVLARAQGGRPQDYAPHLWDENGPFGSSSESHKAVSPTPAGTILGKD